MKPCPALWQQMAEWVLRLLSIDSNHDRELGAGRSFAGLSGKNKGSLVKKQLSRFIW
jgi:hypothetical protein